MRIWCGFSKNNSSLFSWLISKSEAREYSHVYIRYDCPITNEPMVFQASKGLVNCMHFDIFKQYNYVVKEYEIECNKEQFLNFYTFKAKNLGKKYSFKQIIWFSIKKLLQVKKWPDYVYNYVKNGEAEYICSEVGAIVCSMVGVKIQQEQLDQISPSDLEEVLINVRR